MNLFPVNSTVSYGTFECVFVFNMVKKCVQIVCGISEVEVETLFLLEIQRWSDKFPPSERTISITAL